MITTERDCITKKKTTRRQVLLSFLGTTDPIRGERDGAMVHILRHYRPEVVCLLFTPEVRKLAEADEEELMALVKHMAYRNDLLPEEARKAVRGYGPGLKLYLPEAAPAHQDICEYALLMKNLLCSHSYTEVEALIEKAQTNQLFLSDDMPWCGERYYLPRPFLTARTDGHTAGADRKAMENLAYTDYQLRSGRYTLKSAKIPGFSGRLTLSSSLSAPMQEVWKLLVFSTLCGIGIKTTLGMGGVSLEISPNSMLKEQEN